MPIRRCTADGQPGFQWGDAGKCYTYPPGDADARSRARRQAERQGRAIERSRRGLTVERLERVTTGRRAILSNERRLHPAVRRLLRRLSGLVTPEEWREAAGARLVPNLAGRLDNVLDRAREEMEFVLRAPRLIEQVDPTDLAATQIGNLIREIGAEALETVREQLAILLERGSHEDVLRAIARTTGLTRRQLAAVERARRHALSIGMTSRAAADAANRTRRRLLAYRSRLIARTEATRYVSAVVQARAEEVAGEGRVVFRQWLSARDGNVDGGDPRGPCARNDDGRRYRLDEPFPSGDFQPPSHPGCRCVLEIWVEQ